MKSVAIATLALGIILLSGCRQEEEEAQLPADTVPLSPPEQQDTTPPTPPTGEPRFVITIEEDSARSITGQACVPGARVDVHAEIGGGAAGNSLWGQAQCDNTVVVKTATIRDPGNGQAVRTQKQGTQVEGQSRCSKNLVGAAPASRVTVVCYFY